MVAVSHQMCVNAPEGEAYAAVRESHLSVVVLLGGLAFKVKKPLRLPFVDLSTRAARERVCRAELALNRRLAPDVYLGLAGLAGLAGLDAPELPELPELPGPAGEPVLVMRRMPLARRLATILATAPAEVLRAVIDDVARQVARLHADAAPETAFDLPGNTERLWTAGEQQLRAYAGAVLPEQGLARLAGLWREYLAGRAGLLRARQTRGLVRDGHGDLLADDIFCLDDGPRILDCLEFDRALRVNDVLADVAFLAMDLDRLGTRPLADVLVNRYRAYSAEHHPRSLEHHYVAYRASVRAKVECLRSAQGDPGAAARGRVLLDLALRRLVAARVHLVLVGGLPGSGKSTLAEAVADDPVDDHDREWALISSDVVRRDLAGGRRSAGPAPFGQGAYDDARTEVTYTELLHRAELALRAGENVVLDASWTAPPLRARAAALARACSAVLLQVRCEAPPVVCRQRLADRLDAHASDADAAVLAGMAARVPNWPEAITVDTTAPLAVAVAAVRDALAAVEVPGT